MLAKDIESSKNIEQLSRYEYPQSREIGSTIYISDMHPMDKIMMVEAFKIYQMSHLIIFHPQNFQYFFFFLS